MLREDLKKELDKLNDEQGICKQKTSRCHSRAGGNPSISLTLKLVLYFNATPLVTCSLATPSVVKETSTTLLFTLRAEQPRPIQQPILIDGRVVFNPQGNLAPTAFPGDRFFIDRTRSEEGCPYGSIFLTALLPFAQSDRIRTASTIATHPTFFVYIPPSRAEVAEFWLSDDQGKVLYHITFAPPNQPGVVGIWLPSEAPGLEVNRFYHWSVNVSCDPNDPSSSMVIESWIQRRELPSSLETTLNQTPLRDRPTVFARQGLWHDALSTLAQLRLTNPQDQRLQDDWSSLLTSVDLQPIAQEPLLQIETPSESETNFP